MKIAWVGWYGPMMIEHSLGLYQFGAPCEYIVGNEEKAGVPKYLTPRIVTDVNKMFQELETFDVIVNDTYFYTKGVRPELISYLPQDVMTYPQWDKLKVPKILIDGESCAGQLDYYKSIAHHYDEILTFNPNFVEASVCAFQGGSIRIYNDPNIKRSIDVLYTGGNLDKGYRKELADELRKGDFNAVIQDLSETTRYEWAHLLNMSKIYISTLSCASGKYFPVHLKGKEVKALLCGCMPLTEEYPVLDIFLRPNIERATFQGINNINKTVQYFLERPVLREQIITSGKQKATDRWENSIMWLDAFRKWGLYNGS